MLCAIVELVQLPAAASNNVDLRLLALRRRPLSSASCSLERTEFLPSGVPSAFLSRRKNVFGNGLVNTEHPEGAFEQSLQKQFFADAGIGFGRTEDASD